MPNLTAVLRKSPLVQKFLPDTTENHKHVHFWPFRHPCKAVSPDHDFKNRKCNGKQNRAEPNKTKQNPRARSSSLCTALPQSSLVEIPPATSRGSAPQQAQDVSNTATATSLDCLKKNSTENETHTKQVTKTSGSLPHTCSGRSGANLRV